MLLVFSLLGRTELTALREELGARREEIILLEEERTQLQLASGAFVDLEAAERYAAEELGMDKPGAGQIRYGALSRPDRVTIHRAELWREELRRLREMPERLWASFP